MGGDLIIYAMTPRISWQYLFLVIVHAIASGRDSKNY